MATRDHVVPKSAGGGQTVWACWTCNTMKGNMTPPQWSAFMAENPEWWKTGPRPFKRKFPWWLPQKAGVRFTAEPAAVRALARQIAAEMDWGD